MLRLHLWLIIISMVYDMRYYSYFLKNKNRLKLQKILWAQHVIYIYFQNNNNRSKLQKKPTINKYFLNSSKTQKIN